MSLTFSAFGGGLVGKATAAANTAFVVTIPPYRTSGGALAGYTRLAQMSVTQGGTANAVYFMRPIGRAVTTAASNSGTNTITLSADPGPSGNGIAANDYVCVQQSDGTILTTTVSSWNSSTKVLTLSANTTANVASGAKVWDFGVYTDTDPVTGAAHVQIPTTANATTTFTAGPAGFAGAQPGDPLLIYNPNATNASTHNFSEFAFSRE
jgi:hypothetical protein